MKQATIFTTLEPCVSRSQHKPCSEWITERGIGRVFIGMLDPNPKIYNKGANRLKEHGVEVHYFPSNLREEIEIDNYGFISQFQANPHLEGRALFDYTNNDGTYTVGNGDCTFETKWSKASDVSIHVYSDAPSVQSIALALGARQIKDVRDASIFDFSSRSRTPKEGEIVIMKNIGNYFAAVKILEVRDRNRSDDRDELVFEYRILDDRSNDFS